MPRAAVAALVAFAVTGCLGGSRDAGPAPSTTPAAPAATGVALTQVLDGLDAPVYVTHAGDGSGRLFVVEQDGRILVARNGTLRPTPFLDIRPLVKSGGEQGLLSVAFHPDHERNGLFFVDYTDVNGDSVIARYAVRGDDPDRADPGSAEAILRVDQPFANHNGGLVLFGPDGYLYVGFGDGGGADDPAGNGQNTLVLLGKLLRIDVNVPHGYAIPPSNPFAAGPQRGEIWAYGLRNPWRFSFDRATGDLFIGDVGQNRWEEIDWQAAASRGGENYGWNRYEGHHEHRPGIALRPVFPVIEYEHAGVHCSVTGGHVYRGGAVPALAGRYVFGDYCSGQLWALLGGGGVFEMKELLSSGLAPSSFGEDEAGELYLVHHEGAVYRFAPA